jgi:trans-aconitate 2-methyltransferase
VSALADGTTAEEGQAFLDTYAELLRSAYPTQPNGTTILPFGRVFAVATVG